MNATLVKIGGTISAAADQSPIVMGFLLGGIMKMICTSPLSSMALTAMLGLNGLAMGIAAIACVGGSFAGISAAAFGIINNAPGTASPIPGLLAPFAFNSPLSVVGALIFAVLGGCLAGYVGSLVFKKRVEKSEVCYA